MKQQRIMTLTQDDKERLCACVLFTITQAETDEEEEKALLGLLRKLSTNTKEEKQGPYTVRHHRAHAAWAVYGPFDMAVATYFYGEHYPYTEETAKAAAEAECNRLNAQSQS